MDFRETKRQIHLLIRKGNLKFVFFFSDVFNSVDFLNVLLKLPCKQNHHNITCNEFSFSSASGRARCTRSTRACWNARTSSMCLQFILFNFFFFFSLSPCHLWGDMRVGLILVQGVWEQLYEGHTKEGLENISKPVTHTAGLQGPPVNGGNQLAVIDFVGANVSKASGRLRRRGHINCLNHSPPSLSSAFQSPRWHPEWLSSFLHMLPYKVRVWQLI